MKVQFAIVMAIVRHDLRMLFAGAAKLGRVCARPRHLVLLGGSAAVVTGLFANDPAHGANALAWVQSVSLPLLAVALAFYVDKAFNDYPQADRQTMLQEARKGSMPMALAYCARVLSFAVLVWAFMGSARAEVPPQSRQYLPIVAAEITAQWPAIPLREYIPGLIEHESCITLKHSRCWSPTAELRTAREKGVGFGQLTVAYRADGSLRFDALAEMRAAHPGLRGLSWSNIYQQPELQIRAVVLKVLGDYRAIGVPDLPGLHFADAAYNGGRGGVNAERRACVMAAGCDPAQWFGHVDGHCLKSKAALYGQRSACDINRHHVEDVVKVRAPKYRGLVSLGVEG